LKINILFSGTPQPYFTLVCFTSFCFNALTNSHFFIYALSFSVYRSSGWSISICLNIIPNGNIILDLRPLVQEHNWGAKPGPGVLCVIPLSAVVKGQQFMSSHQGTTMTTLRHSLGGGGGVEWGERKASSHSHENASAQ
jgi:hypothetical protein